MFNCKFCDKKSIYFSKEKDAYECDCCGKESVFFIEITEELL